MLCCVVLCCVVSCRVVSRREEGESVPLATEDGNKVVSEKNYVNANE